MVLSTAGPSIPILAHRERPATATAAPLGSPQSPRRLAVQPTRRAESARARAHSPSAVQRLRAHELVETDGDETVRGEWNA